MTLSTNIGDKLYIIGRFAFRRNRFVMTRNRFMLFVAGYGVAIFGHARG